MNKAQLHKLREDWTLLCRLLEKPRNQEGPRRLHHIPAALRYLVWDEAVFNDAALPPSLAKFGKPPITGKIALVPSDGEKARHIRARDKRPIKLRRMWRWHLLAGGCEVPYPFARLADDSGSAWRSL